MGSAFMAATNAATSKRRSVRLLCASVSTAARKSPPDEGSLSAAMRVAKASSTVPAASRSDKPKCQMSTSSSRTWASAGTWRCHHFQP